jgi:rod shape determining protein RodA
MSRYVSYRDFDWVLMGFVLVICALGVLQIHSATEHTKFAGAHIKQIYWILAGVGAMFLVSLLNYQAVLEQIHWMYIASLASLIAVIMFGQKYLGARRWIKMPGGAHFQPSEWVKLILILAVAKYFADLHERELSWPDFLKAGAIVGVPMLMVLAQPDLGTALTYLPVAIMGLFLGGLRWKQALIVVMIAGLLVPVAWMKVLKSYQKERLTSFMNPEGNSQGSGYQVNQSKIAEEHGFVGALAVLLLYFIVLMRLTQNAQTAPDRAGAFLVMGVVAVLSFHILVNVGMVVGFMPVTGIPLPLMSYGGSSVLFMFLALGIVMNVRMRRFVN